MYAHLVLLDNAKIFSNLLSHQQNMRSICIAPPSYKELVVPYFLSLAVFGMAFHGFNFPYALWDSTSFLVFMGNVCFVFLFGLPFLQIRTSFKMYFAFSYLMSCNYFLSVWACLFHFLKCFWSTEDINFNVVSISLYNLNFSCLV